MNILVCVKRVPATAGKITLTPDERAIDTKFLAFTVSPHEECAVEEAVRARGEGEPSLERATARGPKLRQAGMHELEQLLSEHLATRVKVQETAKAGGKVVVEFADLDDLERIYRAMTEPPVPD